MNENDQAEFTEVEATTEVDATLLLEDVVSKLGKGGIQLTDEEKKIVLVLWSVGASADFIVYFFQALREMATQAALTQVLASAPDFKNRLTARRAASSSQASPVPTITGPTSSA